MGRDTCVSRGAHRAPFRTKGDVGASSWIEEELRMTEVEEMDNANIFLETHGEVMRFDVA